MAMTPDRATRLELCIPAALRLLGDFKFDGHQARALMTAIALQESRVEQRAQIGGPAKGWWQFEQGGGTNGVLTHHATRDRALELCFRLGYYKPTAESIYRAIEHNDILAAGFARLLLYSDPRALPREAEGPAIAWEYYLRNWRPGKPHPATWAEFWQAGWNHWR